MAYIGNIPAEAYISISSQTFTTINGTDYTLSSSVESSEDIALFLNNVRQKPSTYTATGTSLTMGTATTTADELYCVYLGKALQTVNPGAGSVGTSQIADDAVTTAKIADLNVTVGKLPASVDLSTKTVTLPASVSGLGTGITNAQLAGSIDVTTKLTGTMPTANLGSGSATGSTYLAGDQTYKSISEYNDDAIQNDIATLALHQATNNNSAKYDLTNTNVDVFQDASGILSLTDCTRNASGEYISCVGTGTQVNFTTDGTWTRGTTTKLSHILLVAGGGGGGYDAGGGGGAGGLVYTTDYVVSGTSYAVTIGTGGAGANTTTVGTSGGDTTFVGDTTLTAKGGGGGGSGASMGGDNGGSGGGSGGGMTSGAGTSTQSSESGVSGTDGFGNDAVVGATDGGGKGGGGGGGAGAAPTATWTASAGSAGGAGKDMSATFGSSVGDSGWFAGGGGGGCESNGTTAAGGQGGGGSGGGPATGAPNATDGDDNTGGGGGGGKNPGGTGGSGFLSLIPEVANATGNFISNNTTANSSTSTVGIVLTYKNASGTNTLNTDIIAEVSADGGANYHTATLSAAGTFSTGVLQAVSNDVSVTAGTSIRYRISFANQAAGSKVAQINGVSLQY